MSLISLGLAVFAAAYIVKKATSTVRRDFKEFCDGKPKPKPKKRKESHARAEDEGW